ncbi:caspase-14 isoform X3 [Anolis carolinensis]|uniref:caspase-14 isoform X3 n=1 Tax=Anolis carolinensis TaxID=28377 RepID=UPI002F2B29A2
MPAIDVDETSGENASSGIWPYSPQNSQQPSDSGHGSLRQHIVPLMLVGGHSGIQGVLVCQGVHLHCYYAIKSSFEWRPMEAERQYDPNIHRLDHYGMKKKRVAFMMCVTEGRAGAEEDIKKMKKWFRTFKFTLLGDCRNPGQETLMQQLRQFRDIINLSNEEISCCLITLMSHGKANGYILDKDNREISLDGIFSLFNNKTCPKLQGKPKIFIIQACRGEQRDYGTLVAGGKPVEPDTWSRPKLPTVSDYFIVYSSQRDHIAVRDENTGSEMISAMDEVFSEHGTQWHIGDLFTKVNSKMIQRDFHLEGEEESVKVTIVMESTLTKALYLSAD